MPSPVQTSEKPSARSTRSFQPVPCSCTQLCQSAPSSLSVIPADQALDVLHRSGGDLARAASARSPAPSCARGRVQERRRPPRRGRRRTRPSGTSRLADHPVGGLRAEAELDPDAVVVRCELSREVERAQARRPRIALVVAVEEAHSLVQPCAPRPPRTPRGRSAPGRPRAGRRPRRSPSFPRSSSGRAHCRARTTSASSSARPSAPARSSFASSRGQLMLPSTRLCVSETQALVRPARACMVTRAKG